MGGYGRFRLTDADLMQMPVIPDLFSPLGLPAAEPMTLSNGLLDFTHSGPVLRIDQARIFNAVAALIAEPEGTIRLDDGSLDLYVMATPVQALEDAVSRIPVIRSFNRAANKLVRLHVVGNWSDPSDRLIRKEPIEDLQQGARGLLEDLSSGAADLTDRVRRTGRSLWGDWFGNEPQDPRRNGEYNGESFEKPWISVPISGLCERILEKSSSRRYSTPWPCLGCIGNNEHAPVAGWSSDRVAEGDGLENRCTARYRRFESCLLR